MIINKGGWIWDAWFLKWIWDACILGDGYGTHVFGKNETHASHIHLHTKCMDFEVDAGRMLTCF